MSGPPTDPLSPAAPGSRRDGRPADVEILDLALRALGGALAVVAAVVTAMLELIFSAVRIGGHLVGVSVLLAVGANVALAWFAHQAVGRVWAVALPAVSWFAVLVAAGNPTAEGDILLVGDWVGLGTTFAGSMTFAVMAFRLILAHDAHDASAMDRTLRG